MPNGIWFSGFFSPFAPKLNRPDTRGWDSGTVSLHSERKPENHFEVGIKKAIWPFLLYFLQWYLLQLLFDFLKYELGVEGGFCFRYMYVERSKKEYEYFR